MAYTENNIFLLLKILGYTNKTQMHIASAFIVNIFILVIFLLYTFLSLKSIPTKLSLK